MGTYKVRPLMEIHPIAHRLVALAPAKLNLFLEITGKRPDGYHEIQTLMVRTDLHDRLTFDRRRQRPDRASVR